MNGPEGERRLANIRLPRGVTIESPAGSKISAWKLDAWAYRESRESSDDLIIPYYSTTWDKGDY